MSEIVYDSNEAKKKQQVNKGCAKLWI